MKTTLKKWLCLIMAIGMFSLSTASAAVAAETGKTGAAGTESTAEKAEDAAEAAEEKAEDAAEAAAEKSEDAAEAKTEDASEAASEKDAESPVDTVEKNGDIYILCTSDIHCGVNQGFGLAGLQQVRDTLEAQGYETILVDDGDAIQGEALGTLSKGEAIIKLMNEMDYDVAIPGNHEYDYGMENFLKLAEEAEFPYISCNFTYKDQLVFKPYLIKEEAGKKIAFVGMTTPETIKSSTPAFFKNKEGEFVYGFMQDESGEKLYKAVQDAVDSARKEGADLVYAMGHMGNVENCAPWTYADVISHTNGIDVFLDGHSHDTDQVVMKNKDGKEVARCAVGTKMNCIGYSHISKDGEILETGIWSWPNTVSAPELLNIQNKMRDHVDEAMQVLVEELSQKVAYSDVHLTVNDPVAKDASGNPIRMIRRAETNIGDFVADAYRVQTEAQIGISNGGNIRQDIQKGDITYGDIIAVNPFGNTICVVEATGQQILDALEWGARSVPDESGAFLQVSGMTYEINTTIPSPCTKDNESMFKSIEGERRVQNVKVGDEPIDPEKTYTIGGAAYTLVDQGDGYTMFDKEKLVRDVKLDNEALIDYITESLNGKIGEEYADPYGQGRIKIIE